jgi:hypothetical protein
VNSPVVNENFQKFEIVILRKISASYIASTFVHRIFEILKVRLG